MLNPLRRLLPLLALILLASVAAPALAAPAANEITLSARPAYEGGFRPGSWMPIVVDLVNVGVDRAVEVRVGTREGAQYGTRLDLPNGGRKSVIVYAYLTPASRRLTARVLGDGVELASQQLSLQPINPSARFVALVAPEGSALRPPARLSSTDPLVAVPVAPADLPDHALGFSGFSSLLLEDVATADLSDRQREALRSWVMRGGQLILGGGTGLARTLAGLPADLAPATAGAVEPVPAETLFGPSAAGLAPVPYVALVPRGAPAGRPAYPLPLASLGARPLPVVEQTLGRGVVTVLAFPLAHPALAGWESAQQLWGELLRSGSELPAGFAPENSTEDSFIEGNLAASLTTLPALQFPPLGLLAGLVGAYIVLVGPVTYLVLRRLDRQSLGWVVVPAITVVFAALTYGLGFAQRGGDVVLNQITLIEPVDGAEAARVRSFVGIFSPERRSYTLTTAGASGGDGTLLRPVSVQGPWDVGGGGAGGFFLQDVAPGAAADGFEVPQWSMRALTTDSIVAMGGAESRLLLEGEKLSGEVTNTGDLPLRDVTLLQGDRVARLGDVAPGETKRGELKRRQGGPAVGFGSTAPVSYLVYGEEIDRQGRAGGQPLPPELQQRVRLLDALYNYGPSTRGGQPLMIAWADTAALTLVPEGVRSDEQHSALVVATPELEAAGDAVTLNAGWMSARFEPGAAACFGGQGTGVTLGQEPAVMRLVLPRDLYGLRASELTLLAASDMPWAEGTTLELFDWAAGTWEQQEVRVGEMSIAEPGRFLGSHGALRVRIGSTLPQANFGCVYLDARIKGALQ